MEHKRNPQAQRLSLPKIDGGSPAVASTSMNARVGALSPQNKSRRGMLAK